MNVIKINQCYCIFTRFRNALAAMRERKLALFILFCIFLSDPLMSDLEPHANNFLVAYSNTLGIEVEERRLGGIFVPTLLELLRDHYEK